MRSRLRSALFLDFDNIFGGLLSLDRDTAKRFATNTGHWLDRLAMLGMEAGSRRDLLVRRAYLNPAGRVEDEQDGNANGFLYLQKFRPDLTRAGFEVIDCPALTAQQKNAADIRMVIDVMTLLDGPGTYDEIIIASSDSDFTPLLRLLRAQDIRTGVISSGDAVAAYKSVAALYVDSERLIELVNEDAPELLPVPTPAADRDPAAGGCADQAAAIVRQIIDHATAPVHLPPLGNRLSRQFRDEINSTNWFGAGSLSGFISAELDSGLMVSGQYVWDPARHATPEERSSTVIRLPESIEDTWRTLELPRLDAPVWHALFEALADYVATHERFNLTECTAWVRDRLVERRQAASRTAVGYVVQGVIRSGTRLDVTPGPDVDTLREAFLLSIESRLAASGIEVSEALLDDVHAWLGGKFEGG